MVTAIAIAFAVATILTWRFLRPESWLHILDHPNERSLHVRPTPRSGGIAILAGIGAALLAMAMVDGVSPLPGWPLAGALVLALVGWLDDLRGLRPSLRLLVHLGVAGSLVAAGYRLDSLPLPGWEWHLGAVAGGVLTLVGVVWMINLYNFMDGMDGLAGGMAVAGFAVISWLAWGQGVVGLALLSAATAAAAAGFLLWNLPPARIFMGDAGSSVIGFLAGWVSLWGVDAGLFSPWVPLVLFSPFIVDATFTLLRRVRRGERVWQAHREHLYQRLVQLGWGRRKILYVEYALMFGSVIAALGMVSLGPGGEWSVLGVVALLYGALIYGVFRLEWQKRG